MERALAERRGQDVGLVGGVAGEDESTAKFEQMKEEMDVSTCRICCFVVVESCARFATEYDCFEQTNPLLVRPCSELPPEVFQVFVRRVTCDMQLT